jgi:hypothetical protein
MFIIHFLSLVRFTLNDEKVSAEYSDMNYLNLYDCLFTADFR